MRAVICTIKPFVTSCNSFLTLLRFLFRIPYTTKASKAYIQASELGLAISIKAMSDKNLDSLAELSELAIYFKPVA